MTFIYDKVSESCHDPDSEITARWSGGGSPAGELQRSFAFAHPDWEVRQTWYVCETGIDRQVTIGDLAKNEVSVKTTVHPGAKVHFHPVGAPQILRRIHNETRDFSALQHDAITCLYNQGDRDTISVTGLSLIRDKAAKKAHA